ncbi:ketoacyl-ACP synthase III [Bacillus wiedmannii]|uniref:ketoacyl-ACP synthase III n=1 Tax=Bacillus wiedmannii TaxID=1890302 RepID=UPI000BF20C98|nr:ketoacyl-ACP synthase III [Bacillus wiedmannii]PEM85120.1 ketoacyl-ACP synthase III [Bacillus wiedmannii]PEO82734.1 ketoacyl-ACP synthase III [Bacillus wiedmannii]
MLKKARITAIGTYVPSKVLSNNDLEKMVDTNDEWIVQRTGIRERRVTRADEYTSDLCVAAIRNLMHRYDKTVKDVDLILVCTSSPDFPFPSVASIIQEKLNIQTSTGAMDLSAACAGFTYGLHTAHSFVSSGLHKKVLVVGADNLTRITDYTDRSTCIIFGDGAGAVLVETDEELSSFMSFKLGTEGKHGIHVYRTGLSNKLGDVELINSPYIVQNGREIMRWVVRNVPEKMERIVEEAGLRLDQVDWFVPHSANLRLIEPICERSGFPIEKTLYSLEKFGNTSAASIPLSLDLGIREGKVKNGDCVLMNGFGSGLVHAGLLIQLQFDPEVNKPEML